MALILLISSSVRFFDLIEPPSKTWLDFISRSTLTFCKGEADLPVLLYTMSTFSQSYSHGGLERQL